MAASCTSIIAQKPVLVISLLAALLQAVAAITVVAATQSAASENLLAASLTRRMLSDDRQLESSDSSVAAPVASTSHATARMLYATFPSRSDDDDRRAHAHFLDPQNEARAEVGSAPLAWDAELQAQAQRLADYIAQKEGCAPQRLSEVSSGVNLRWAAESLGVEAEARAAVAEWVREKAHYRRREFPAGCEKGRECTRYTQVVWKETKSVGCGSSMCNEGGAIWACRYFPPGNIKGDHPY